MVWVSMQHTTLSVPQSKNTGCLFFLESQRFGAGMVSLLVPSAWSAADFKLRETTLKCSTRSTIELNCCRQKDQWMKKRWVKEWVVYKYFFWKFRHSTDRKLNSHALDSGTFTPILIRCRWYTPFYLPPSLHNTGANLCYCKKLNYLVSEIY